MDFRINVKWTLLSGREKTTSRKMKITKRKISLLKGNIHYEKEVRASAHRASLSQFRLLREGEDVWSWFPAAETTSQEAVSTEPEAAQTLLGPMGSRGLGEN